MYLPVPDLSLQRFCCNKLKITFVLPINLHYIAPFFDIPVIPSPTIIGVFGIDLIILGEIATAESF